MSAWTCANGCRRNKICFSPQSGLTTTKLVSDKYELKHEVGLMLEINPEVAIITTPLVGLSLQELLCALKM